MITYIAIMRGVNVGGKNKINMNELVTLLERLNYKKLRTYIQSGNIIFQSNMKDSNALSEQIAQKIFEKYTYQVPVIIRTLDELQNIIAYNPLLKTHPKEIDKLHITFLSDVPQREQIKIIEEFHAEPDTCIISGKEVYLCCPNGYGKTKLNNNFFENKLHVTATTRNWNTVMKLSTLASELKSS